MPVMVLHGDSSRLRLAVPTLPGPPAGTGEPASGDGERSGERGWGLGGRRVGGGGCSVGSGGGEGRAAGWGEMRQAQLGGGIIAALKQLGNPSRRCLPPQREPKTRATLRSNCSPRRAASSFMSWAAAWARRGGEHNSWGCV